MYFDYDTIMTFWVVNVWVFKNHILKKLISGDHLIHPKIQYLWKNYKHSQNSWCANGLHHFSSSFQLFWIVFSKSPKLSCHLEMVWKTFIFNCLWHLWWWLIDKWTHHYKLLSWWVHLEVFYVMLWWRANKLKTPPFGVKY
jgi:hypothetical protein